MCGITGYVGKGGSGDLEQMVKSLHHRGPDDCGTYTHRNVGLGQTRLSIIDLSPAGHQPMGNEDGTVWIVFNGEIYNHHDLRKLLKKPHQFKGRSDTEVIVHLYEECGAEVFSKLEGMFAIALYDTRNGKLFLARDRMGKKPLYWSMKDGTLLFGSELKALMAHPSFCKEIDPHTLNKYFLYEYVPTPHTIFKNTWKLEPGTLLEWDGAETRKTVFWKPTFLPKTESSLAESMHALEVELRGAVERRLEADVPLGIFLSGGIDSSTVAYYASKLHPGRVKTFSIGFREPSFDESSHARTVARHLGTEHYEEMLSVQDCLRLIPEVGSMLDEPMADASIIPTYLLSQFTKKHVTVALGGDGGDELFCGYDTFLAHKVARVYGHVPSALREVIRNAVEYLPTSHKNMSLDFKLKKATRDFEGDRRYLNQRWLGAFSREERAKLFIPEVWDEAEKGNEFEDIDRYYGEMDSHMPYDELSYVYERMYMMDQVLVKVDRSSMMHALEVRAPFLDTHVVDLANHMPTSFKFRGFERKYILKKLMEGKLPRDIIYRKKKGFGIPIGAWLRAELSPLVTELLSPESLRRTGLFNERYVEDLIRDHVEGRRDNRKKLWTLMVFMMWWNRWMGEKKV
jgi:asparagine synthase (glutamine-hydrolysing)